MHWHQQTLKHLVISSNISFHHYGIPVQPPNTSNCHIFFIYCIGYQLVLNIYNFSLQGNLSAIIMYMIFYFLVPSVTREVQCPLFSKYMQNVGQRFPYIIPTQCHKSKGEYLFIWSSYSLAF